MMGSFGRGRWLRSAEKWLRSIEIRPKCNGRAETRNNVVTGRIVRTTYVGDLFQYDVDVGPSIVQVEKPTAAGPQPFNQGDEVELEWAAGDTLVFEQSR